MPAGPARPRPTASAKIRPSSAIMPGTLENSDDSYHKVGKKKPNPWGLYDMHGNVSEWTLDQYVPTGYQEFAGKLSVNPMVIPKTLYPQAVRGGAWTDDAAARCAAPPAWDRARLEGAGSQLAAKHLVFHRRAVPRLSPGPPVGRTFGQRESREMGSRPRRRPLGRPKRFVGGRARKHRVDDDQEAAKQTPNKGACSAAAAVAQSPSAGRVCIRRIVSLEYRSLTTRPRLVWAWARFGRLPRPRGGGQPPESTAITRSIATRRAAALANHCFCSRGT